MSGLVTGSKGGIHGARQSLAVPEGQEIEETEGVKERPKIIASAVPGRSRSRQDSDSARSKVSRNHTASQVRC